MHGQDRLTVAALGVTGYARLLGKKLERAGDVPSGRRHHPPIRRLGAAVAPGGALPAQTPLVRPFSNRRPCSVGPALFVGGEFAMHHAGYPV